jgi:acyl-CoA reductase-like NAD-dependent aldehyde dehydrogenase
VTSATSNSPSRAARAAFDSGRVERSVAGERAQIVIRFADLIEAASGQIALADSRSMGGTLAWVGGGLWVAPTRCATSPGMPPTSWSGKRK